MKARILAEENRKWWTLAAVSFGLFMIMLDNTVVNVALPSIERDLNDVDLVARVDRHGVRARRSPRCSSPAASSPTCYGRRRIFVVGLVVFTLSSLACGLAPSAGFLIGARAVQGIGAALMNPATLSIITATFPPRQRGHGDRHLGRRLRDRARDRPARRRPDRRQHQLELDLLHQRAGGRRGHRRLAASSSPSRATPRTSRASTCPGCVTSGVGLFALTYALIEGNEHGWASPEIVGLFVAAAVLLGGVRPRRAPPAAADARPLAVQEPARSPARTSSRCSSRSGCSASSSSSRCTSRTSSATRRRRRARSSCR